VQWRHRRVRSLHILNVFFLTLIWLWSSAWCHGDSVITTQCIINVPFWPGIIYGSVHGALEKETGQSEVIFFLYSTVQYSTVLMFLSDLEPVMGQYMVQWKRRQARLRWYVTCTVQYSTVQYIINVPFWPATDYGWYHGDRSEGGQT
jgi:hypothetical protein